MKRNAMEAQLQKGIPSANDSAHVKMVPEQLEMNPAENQYENRHPNDTHYNQNDHNDSDTESLGSQNESNNPFADVFEPLNHFEHNFIDHDKTALIWVIHGKLIL